MCSNKGSRGGSERKPQLRACSRKRSSRSGPAACCCADAVGAVLPRFRRHCQPLELGHFCPHHPVVPSPYHPVAYGCATSSILVQGFLSGGGDRKMCPQWHSDIRMPLGTHFCPHHPLKGTGTGYQEQGSRAESRIDVAAPGSPASAALPQQPSRSGPPKRPCTRFLRQLFALVVPVPPSA